MSPASPSVMMCDPAACDSHTTTSAILASSSGESGSSSGTRPRNRSRTSRSLLPAECSAECSTVQTTGW